MGLWRAVPGWEGLYEVSDTGHVRSLDRVVPGRHGPTRYQGRVLATYGAKYPVVCLAETGAGRKQYRYVHDLVLGAFVGPKPCGLEACHNNGNRKDNSLANLRYDTRSANARDTQRHRILRGEKHPGWKHGRYAA